MAVEAVDAHLREAAVLAVVLDAHPGLERKALGQARGVGPFEQAGVQHAHRAERLADTTTSSIEMPLCTTSKFSSAVCPRLSVTCCVCEA